MPEAASNTDAKAEDRESNPMKTNAILCAAVLAWFGGAAQPAIAGNAEEIERCADAIHTGREVTVTVGGFKFMCRNQIVVSTDPLQRGMGTFAPSHAHYEGNFVRVNPVIANDRVRFFITVENWNARGADPTNCQMAQPVLKIERNSRWLKIAEYIPNWEDWKNLPRKIDGKWERAAFAIAAAAIRKWQRSYEFAVCKRNW